MENNTKKTVSPIAVLLMAYGSPENLVEVEPYYLHIRGGMRPDESLIANLKNRYEQVGGKTPLHEMTKKQAAALQKVLDEKEGSGMYKVFIGMKHWHPFIGDTVDHIRAEGIKKIIALALAPHYSQISIGGYKKSLDLSSGDMSVKLVESWHTNPYLIDCIVDQLTEALTESEADQQGQSHVIFTAHSLPERIKEWNDPYPEQLLETCRLVSAQMPDMQWSFAYQSAGMMGGPWLGPDIQDVLARKKDAQNIVVCPIGFVSDNLEIVYDLDIESKTFAADKNIRLSRVKSRNIHPLFIRALYEEIIRV